MAVRTILARGALALAAVLPLASFAHAQNAPAPLLETPALQAIVVDGGTGAVLFEKSADEPFPPASLAKLMTLELVFAGLESGLVTPATAYPVSENAWRTGGAPSRRWRGASRCSRRTTPPSSSPRGCRAPKALSCRR